MVFADVILPLFIAGKLTYKVPDKFRELAIPGKRAVVPLGKNKLYTGIIARIHNEEPDFNVLKDIIDVLDDAPVVLPQQLELWDWIASYYMCEPGEVFKAALPAGLRLESDSYIALNPEFADFSSLNSREYLLVSELSTRGKLSLGEVSKILVTKSPQSFIKRLQDRKVLVVFDILSDGPKVKTKLFLRLTPAYHSEEALSDLSGQLKKATKQLELLFHFLELTEGEELSKREISKEELVEKFPGGAAAVKSLEAKSVFEVLEKTQSRFEAYPKQILPPKALNPFQEEAYKSVLEAFDTKQTALLHGVTSSGKTEIYIHLMKRYLDAGYQVLYLLPEIALTTQIIQRLRVVFGDKVGVYHSKFSDAERSELWNTCLSNSSQSARIILGARSAVFLPFVNLGLVIVDEEHESSFKQYAPAPRYHARDLAIVLARMYDAKVLLGSATPSLESYYNASTGKYAYIRLSQRYLNLQLPEIVLADVRKERLKRKMQDQFTPLLIQEISSALERKEQVILFQNRRGYAPFSICYSCGWIPRCQHCDVSLTHHKGRNILLCHYCGYSIQPTTVCPECGAREVALKGFGTEKLEMDLQKHFPEASILRMDQDTTRGKFSNEKIINQFSEGKTNILVGTQMVTKGLDFDNVSLVGIMDADSILNFPDFRAFERSFQLMAQVSGRAGRKNKRGKVIVQTLTIGHPVIQNIVENDFEGLAKTQLHERLQFHYPPFYRLIEISVRHKDRSVVNHAAREFYDLVRPRTKADMLGPEFPAVSMIQNYHIKQILVKVDKSQNPAIIRSILTDARRILLAMPGFGSVQLIFDVDPA